MLLRVDPPMSGRDNMRIDESLLETQKDPAAVPVLRLFRWAHPTISYGRLQAPDWAASTAKTLGAEEIVRRPTGGGLVRHEGDLSLSLAWRRDHTGFPKCLKNIYRAVHETAAGALDRLGVRTEFFKPTSRLSSAPGLCFSEPAEDDLMWRGRKVLGGALRVTGWGRLYQGHLLTRALGLNEESCAEAFADAFRGGLAAEPLSRCR